MVELLRKLAPQHAILLVEHDMDAVFAVADVITLRGNVGVRYVKTKQSATGYQATAGGTQVTVDQEYSDTLPAGNLVLTLAAPPVLRVAVPGTSMALPQMPFVSLATKAWEWPEPSMYVPPAAQLPAVAHETDCTFAVPPVLRIAVPGTLIALPQVPLVWSMTNAWSWLAPSR